MKRLKVGILVSGLAMAAMLFASCSSGVKSIAELDARGLFVEGERLYKDGKYRQSIQYFQTIVFNYPGNSVVDTAQYYLGLSYFGNEEYELAAIEFNRLATNYPASLFFEHAMFMRAVSFFEATPRNPGLDQTELQKAITQFEDFLIDFPESPLIPDVKKYLLAARSRMAKKAYNAAMVYERIGGYEAASLYFQYVIDNYADTDFGAPAAYHKALMQLRMKKFADAREQFENFIGAFPEHKLVPDARDRAAEAAFKNCRSTFDAGKLAEARQCLQEFKQAYPNNGHGDDAEDLLEEIDRQPAAKEAPEHAES